MALLALLLLAFSLQASPYVDQRIAYAKEQIKKQKDRPQGYSDLAIALARRARETDDPAYLKQAEDAINDSLRVAPANFEARKARVIVRLQQNRFADALEEAQALNKQVADDNLTYGLIADAQIALGNYQEAEKATQFMIDMQQVNAPGIKRGAELRELFGFPEGANDWWNSALRITSANDTEERAWILTRMAQVQLRVGKKDIADKYLQQAFALDPDYPWALTAMAMVRMAQERPAEAVDLLRKRLARHDDLESSYQLARALEKSGRADEAKKAYADFEKAALAASGQPANANRDLILYLADHDKAKDAARLAREELARRHDAFTLDAAAWALYRAGDFTEARKQIDKALAAGIRDAGIFYHAGAIALKLNDTKAAKGFLKNSLEVDASSEDSAKVLKTLAAGETAP